MSEKPSVAGFQPQEALAALKASGVDVDQALSKGRDVMNTLGVKKTMTGLGVGLVLLSMIVPEDK